MFGIIKTIMIALSLSTPTNTIAVQEIPSSFVGTWNWEQTIVSGRGGQRITDASAVQTTKHIVITAEHKVQVFENGVISCEGELLIKEGATHNGYSHQITNNCFPGAFKINDKGELQQYVYLGCPSSTSIFSKKN